MCDRTQESIFGVAAFRKTVYILQAMKDLYEIHFKLNKETEEELEM